MADGGNTVPRITRAEHIGPADTGDNIEAKRVANYVWDGANWQRASSASAGDGALLDGVTSSIKATVKNYTNSNPLTVRLTDTNGDYVAAGAGTQYTEDAASAADPVGSMLMGVRRDTLSATEVSADGDNIALKATNKGQLHVKQADTVIVDGSGVTQPVSEADGANVTLGAKADAKSTATDTTAVSAMSVLKQISASVQAPPAQAATSPSLVEVDQSVTSATTVFTQDVSTYNGVSVQLLATVAWSGVTVQFEVSNDNSTWQACLMQASNSLTAPLSATTSVGIYYGSLRSHRYFRVRVSAYTSGTVRAVAEFGVGSPIYQTMSVDSELPTPAALADTRSNPTEPSVGADTSVFSTTNNQWNRQKAVEHGINSAGVGHATAGILAEFDDASPTAITENQFGTVRMSANRNLYNTIRDAAGNERGANVTAGNALVVDGSAATQPVSGTVSITANSSVNMAQINGVTTTMNNGVAGTGVQRVTIASDSTGQVSAAVNATATGASISYQSALTNTKVAVNASAGNLYGWHIYNPNSSVIYIQLFNVASASVTLGSTAPTMVLVVPANGWLDDPALPTPIAFGTALTVAATTTASGLTAPTSTSIANFFYK